MRLNNNKHFSSQNPAYSQLLQRNDKILVQETVTAGHDNFSNTSNSEEFIGQRVILTSGESSANKNGLIVYSSKASTEYDGPPLQDIPNDSQNQSLSSGCKQNAWHLHTINEETSMSNSQ